GTAMVVEVEVGAHGVSSLSMGIGKEDRHKGAGLQTWKGSKAAVKKVGFGVSQAAS
ncbi:hypothetical protein THAOC_11448, partial [Thalassiosira oceanica]